MCGVISEREWSKVRGGSNGTIGNRDIEGRGRGKEARTKEEQTERRKMKRVWVVEIKAEKFQECSIVKCPEKVEGNVAVHPSNPTLRRYH